MKRFSNVATLAALVALIFPPPVRDEKKERDAREAAARLAHQPKQRPKSNKQLEAEAAERRRAREISR